MARLTKGQHGLLSRLDAAGGAFDRYLRIVAEGYAASTTTCLSCFRHEWIEVKDGRVWLTLKGETALAEHEYD